jgi:hypothetical protein
MSNETEELSKMLPTTDICQYATIASSIGVTLIQLIKILIDCYLKRHKEKAARRALDTLMDHYSSSNDKLNDNIDEMTHIIANV